MTFPYLVGTLSGLDALVAARDPVPAAPDILEVRIDNIGVDKIDDTVKAMAGVKSAGGQLLFTLRSATEGGPLRAPDQAIALYEKALAVADWVDVEASVPYAEQVFSMARQAGVQTIASFHDFHKTLGPKLLRTWLPGPAHSGRRWLRWRR